MLLKDVERHVGRTHEGKFVYPRYDGYSLVNVPNTAMRILGVKGPGPVLGDMIYKGLNTRKIKKVVIILIDGFGYQMLKDAYKREPFLRKFIQKGMVAPITSGFPSNTSVSLTSFNTGLTPQEHGVLEWILYLREVDEIVNTVPFNVGGSTERDSLKKRIDPKTLYNGDTIYQLLKKRNVASYTFTPMRISDTVFDNLVKKGSKKISYMHNSDLPARLREVLEKEKGKALLSAYIDTLDQSTHHHGPFTEESRAEILSIFHSLERGLKKIDAKTAEETLIIITADHGHIKVDPRKTLYLDKDKFLNKVYSSGKNKKPILPTGSPRDLFMHVKENKIDETYLYLSRKFKNKAKIMKVQQALHNGLFGYGKVNKEFHNRTGNIMVLPYGNRAIWNKKVRKIYYNGLHGGLSKDEMLIPFAATRLSDII